MLGLKIHHCRGIALEALGSGFMILQHWIHEIHNLVQLYIYPQVTVRLIYQKSCDFPANIILQSEICSWLKFSLSILMISLKDSSKYDLL